MGRVESPSSESASGSSEGAAGFQPGDPGVWLDADELALSPLASGRSTAARAHFQGVETSDPGREPLLLRFWADGETERALAAAGLSATPCPPAGDGPDRIAPGRLVSTSVGLTALLGALDAAPRAAHKRLLPLVRASRALLAPPAVTRVMAVINVTPDSFSDGGALWGVDGRLDLDRLLARAEALVAAGATCLDIGGESTRPGSRGLDPASEAARVLPAVERLVGRFPGVCLSIDTQKSTVAEAALERGADWINDVSAGSADPRMLEVVARFDAHLVLMHRRGEPSSMQVDPRYRDPLFDVALELRLAARTALDAGIRAERLLLDPGLGFGKRLEHNLALLARLDELRSIGCPLVLGASRKAFLGALSGQTRAAERGIESLAAAVVAALCGASWVRVHDVPGTTAALAVANAVARAPEVAGWN